MQAATAAPTPEPQTSTPRSASAVADRVADLARLVGVVDAHRVRVGAEIDDVVRLERLQNRLAQMDAAVVEGDRDLHASPPVAARDTSVTVPGTVTEVSRHPLEQRGRPRHDVVDGVAEPLQHLGAGRRLAEAVEADDVAAVADPAVPAERDAGLDREPRRDVAAAAPRRGTPAAAPRRAPSRASRRRAPRFRASAILRPASSASADLRAGADQDQVGLPVGRVPERVGAALEAARRGELVAVERRHLLAREREADRAVLRSSATFHA